MRVADLMKDPHDPPSRLDQLREDAFVDLGALATS
jgi:hypothetical protein